MTTLADKPPLAPKADRPDESAMREGRWTIRRLLILAGGSLAVWFAAGGSTARGDIVVTLEVSDADGPVTGRVRPGTELFVDILLSVRPEDDPLKELRSIQLDFRGTGAGLELTDFEWLFDELGLPGSYFADLDLPSFARADHIGAGDILDLDSEPLSVGRATITANDSATFDVTGAEVADPDNVDQGLRFRAGVDDPRDFSIFDGDVQGGTVSIRVGRRGGDDNENGNQNDNENANDNENENGNDNGGDLPGGGGTNANDSTPDRNVGPKAQFQFCGFGTASTFLLAFGGLTLMRLRRRRWRQTSE